jgi:uncharacterized SAM-binding protein YcdF (DUF218 family)
MWRSLKRFIGRVPVILFLILSVMFLLWRQSPQNSFAQLPVDDTVVVAVLGGGVLPSGGVPQHTQARLEVALQVYRELGPRALFITLSGGTPHKPNPVDSRGFPIWEATAAAKQLIEMGVPQQQVLEESFSLDTVGNVMCLI